MKEEEVVIGKKEIEEAYNISLTDEQYIKLHAYNTCMATEKRRYPVFNIIGVLKTLGVI